MKNINWLATLFLQQYWNSKHFFLDCPIYNNQIITLMQIVARFTLDTLGALLKFIFFLKNLPHRHKG